MSFKAPNGPKKVLNTQSSKLDLPLNGPYKLMDPIFPHKKYQNGWKIR